MSATNLSGTSCHWNDHCWKTVTWCLRVVLLSQCFGVALATWQNGTPINALLFNDSASGGWNWSEESAIWVDHTGAAWSLAAAVWIIVVPAFTRRRWPWRELAVVLQVVALLWIIVWQLSITLAAWELGGTWTASPPFGWQWDMNPLEPAGVEKHRSFYELSLTLGEHAARILAPLALLIFCPIRRGVVISRRRIEMAVWLMRLAASATFLIHGWNAIQLSPHFIDLLIGSADNLLDWTLPQATAETLLRAIGMIDVVLAILVLACRWRVIAGYMAFWGIVTACSRMTAVAWQWGLAESLLRAANGGLPLAILLYWWYTSRGRAIFAPSADPTKDSE